MDTPDFISLIGTLLSFILALCFVYRIVYFLIGLFGRSPVQNTTHQCRYGVLISARNEEAVISDLIHSIQGQDYPSDLVTIFVIADNCTDRSPRRPDSAYETCPHPGDGRKLHSGPLFWLWK